MAICGFNHHKNPPYIYFRICTYTSWHSSSEGLYDLCYANSLNNSNICGKNLGSFISVHENRTLHCGISELKQDPQAFSRNDQAGTSILMSLAFWTESYVHPNLNSKCLSSFLNFQGSTGISGMF